MDDPPNNLPRRPHEVGDEWVYGPDGVKYWGRFGAAGLLVWHRELGVLLQKRATWSHFGQLKTLRELQARLGWELNGRIGSVDWPL